MRRRKVWKGILGIVAGMAALVAVSLWFTYRSAQTRATAVFESHQKELEARIVSLRARKGPRALIYGDVRPGNGWESMVRALEGFKAIPEADANQIPEVNGAMVEADYPPPATLDTIFTRHTKPFDEIRTALQHTGIRAGYRYEEGLSLPLPSLIEAIGAGRFLAGLATHEHRASRDALAVEPVLLGLGMAQEVGRDGPLISALVQIVCEGTVIEAWRTVMESHDLSAADLERAARAFDALLAARPGMAEALEVEDVVGRMTLVTMGRTGVDSAEYELEGIWAGRSWRYLYSRRLVYAGALPALERHYREQRSLEILPPSRRIVAAERIDTESLKDRNPFVQRLIPTISKLWKREAVALMNWTLMRVATAIAGYEAEKGAPPASLADLVPRHLARVPECPWSGKPIGYVPGKVWSYGVDGVDDGGTPNPKGDEEPGGDVVWVVKRK